MDLPQGPDGSAVSMCVPWCADLCEMRQNEIEQVFFFQDSISSFELVFCMSIQGGRQRSTIAVLCPYLAYFHPFLCLPCVSDW